MVITPYRGCRWGYYRLTFFRPSAISNLDATHSNPRKQVALPSIETPIDFDFLQG
jgi:hypothetical protein